MSGNEVKVIKQTETKEMAKTTLDILSAYPQFPYGTTGFSWFFMDSALWISIGFQADPDPSFHLNTDPDLGSQTDQDLRGSGSGSWSHFGVIKS